MGRWNAFQGTALCCAMVLGLLAIRASADEISSRGVLADALAAANRIDDSDLRSQALDTIASALAKLGDAAVAKQIAEAITAGPSGNSADAETAAGWRRDAYAAIAAAQAGAGDMGAASTTLGRIDDSGARELALQYITQALAEKGDIATAQACAARIDGLQHTRAEAAIAKAQAAAGDFDAAKQTAADLNDAIEQSLALSSIAEAQAREGDFPGAKETLGQAKTAVAQVPEFLAHTVLGEFAKAEVLAGNLADASAMEKADSPYIAREVAIGRAETGDITGAKSVVGQISTPLEQARADAGIAEAQAKAGDAMGAMQTLGAARTVASSVTETSGDADAYASVVEAWVKLGDPSGAADWARSRQDPFVQVKSLVSVALALGNTQTASNR